MTFWRYKLLEAAVHLGVGILMIPPALLLLALVLQFVSADNPLLVLVLVGLPYIIGSLVLTNRVTTRIAKRRGL